MVASLRATAVFAFFISSMLTLGIALTTAAQEEFKVPKIGLEQLMSNLEAGRDDFLDELKDVGGRIGVFAITNLPESYKMALDEFTNEAPTCLSTKHARHTGTDLPRLTMPDNSTRTTYATESGTYPMCLNMTGLSNTFDQVEDIVTNLIERVHGKPLHYISDTKEVSLKDSPAKDHIHVYESPTSPTKDGMMVPFHIDNGMFLIITPFQGHGLQVELSNGERVTTKDVDSSSVLVLVGRGLTEWLFQPGGFADHETMQKMLLPVPHAVESMNKIDISKRSVYARMKVAPDLAVPSVAAEGMHNRMPMNTFRDVFMEAEPEDNSLCMVGPLVSDAKSMKKMWNKVMDGMCKEGTAYCWMGCMNLPDSCNDPGEAKCFSDKKNLTCRTDPSGKVMDPTCKWQCDKKPSKMIKNDYCNGGMSMFMLGFQATGVDRNNPCVILFINAWTLDTRWKFGIACVGVLLIGLIIEMLVFFRRKLLTKKFTLRMKTCRILLFATNIFFAYLIMLVAMTYSIELFACVIIGLVIGHAIFNDNAPVGETVDPCCAPSSENTAFK